MWFRSKTNTARGKKCLGQSADQKSSRESSFNSLTDTDDFGTEADVYLSEELSLYKQLTLTARKDPYYSAVRAKLIPTEQSVKEYGIERESLIKLCTYNNHPCADNAGSFKYFWKTWRHTKYGKCYTFNHRETNFSMKQENNISSTGHTSGLHLTLSINEEVYLPLMSPVVGAVMGVSPSYQFPTPEMNTVILQPGVKILLSLKKNVFKKLGTPYSKCVTTYPDFIMRNSHYLSDNTQRFLTSYETNFCTQMCQALHQLLSCETGACRYGYLLSKSVTKAEGIPDCDLDKQDHFNCYSETKARIVNSSNCGCVQGCEQDYFSQFMSVGTFPSKAYVPFLLNSILSSDPDVLKFGEENKWAEDVVDALREVDDYMTDAVIENVTKILRRSLVDVHVFMDSLYVDTISEAPAYTIINLLADFGGNSGLYVGFCALSLFEIIEFFWDVGFALIKRKVCGIVSYYDDDGDEEEANAKKLSRASGNQGQPVAGTLDDTAL